MRKRGDVCCLVEIWALFELLKRLNWERLRMLWVGLITWTVFCRYQPGRSQGALFAHGMEETCYCWCAKNRMNPESLALYKSSPVLPLLVWRQKPTDVVLTSSSYAAASASTSSTSLSFVAHKLPGEFTDDLVEIFRLEYDGFRRWLHVQLIDWDHQLVGGFIYLTWLIRSRGPGASSFPFEHWLDRSNMIAPGENLHPSTSLQLASVSACSLWASGHKARKTFREHFFKSKLSGSRSVRGPGMLIRACWDRSGRLKMTGE